MSWTFYTSSGSIKQAPTSVSVPTALISNSTSQLTANNTEVAVTFGTVGFDTDSMTGTANKITITHAGKYRFTALVQWAANATGYRYIWIRKNGASSRLYGFSTAVATSSVDQTLIATEDIDCLVGDSFEVISFQNSGGNLNISPNSNARNTFSAEKIDGAVVSYVGVPGSLIGQELAYIQKTTDTSITATTAATGQNVATTGSISCNGTDVFMIELSTYGAFKGTTWIKGVLFMDGSLLQDLMFFNNGAGCTPGTGKLRYTPSAGSHTFGFNAYVDAGTGTIGATSGSPAFIRITRAA